MKKRARKLLHEAAQMADASTLGEELRAKRERLLAEAQRLRNECAQNQQDLARAVTHPATRHTAAASGAQPGEPLDAFPRAVRRTLLELGGPAGLGRPARPHRGREGQGGHEGWQEGRGKKGQKGKGKR